MTEGLREVEVYADLENFRKVFTKNKQEVLKYNLSDFVSLLATVPIPKLFSGLFLELIVKLSEALYWKSCLLLNTPPKEEVNPDEESPQEEEFFRKREFCYYQLIPFDRVLEEKIFLPQSPDIHIDPTEVLSKEETQQALNLLLQAFIRVLERENLKTEVLERLPHLSIEDYIEEVHQFLQKRPSFYFKEFLRTKRVDLLKVVCYFLALLFMCFYEQCRLVQNHEQEDILVIKI
ncbi:hypothetical protein F1847_00760 [Thermodesulfobacterium sp. TA1]|uniref:hypothetical protein n=1 Tax=Thermodesulfobacterium sp. TA1 TaxID=2234087 RepID=UPI0012326E2F|nr:hypothetical protein [Thermodesulfobacterium sp. TA1]QER41338.1 hypothetical protein F1847_00760 [Thermodesulfobacterium sp. TA1]